MTDLQLYTKLSGLPVNLKAEVSDFIDFLKQKTFKKGQKPKNRIAGKAKGQIVLKDNFDAPIEGFDSYFQSK